MKKMILIGIASCSLLVACSNENQTETSAVTPKESNTANQQIETTNQQLTEESLNENKGIESTTEPIDSKEWDQLTASITTILKKVQETIPTGTNSEQMTQFLALNQEIETLENQLDVYEDQIEVQFQSNQITANQFRTTDNEIEALENQLNQAEDILERVFQLDND